MKTMGHALVLFGMQNRTMGTYLACAGHKYNRATVTALGCGIWGVMTAAFGACRGLAAGRIVWGINGLGLALVIPAGQASPRS
jgi:hypothetical protein